MFQAKRMSNKTLAIFIVCMLAISVATAAVTGVFSSVKIGANTVIPAGTPGYTGTSVSGYLVLSDSPALIGVPTAPTAEAGTNTTQIATTAFVTGAIGQFNRSCNSNGCYVLYPDGTLEEWGHSSALGSATSAGNVTITFPASFTTTTNLSLVVSASSDATGDGSPHAADCHVTGSTLSTSGATAVIAAVIQIGGSGYSNLAATDVCTFHAIGY